MSNLSRTRPRLLLVSMYPLDQGTWGPTVRISHLRAELEKLSELDVIAGYRGPRRIALARYAASGRLRGLAGIYVESSSFLPAEADVMFLALARGLGIPVLTYIRDAYQLFEEYSSGGGFRQRIGAAAYLPMLRLLGLVSSRLAFPSAGLMRAVGVDCGSAVLVPPGAPPPVDVPRRQDANQFLFVGDARLPAHGADRLVQALGRARDSGIAVELTIVCRPGQEPPGPHPAWVTMARAQGPQIHRLLPNVMATVIPRPRTPYNDIALPIKLFDYLAWGRPLIVTDCIEQARIVREADAGLVVGDGIADLADGLARLATAPPSELDRWSANATAAAISASWRRRAEAIVGHLGLPS